VRKLEIFEPPLCCSTGVCGPASDPALARLQEDILRWKKAGGGAVDAHLRIPVPFL
jgi:hypothetical protein